MKMLQFHGSHIINIVKMMMIIFSFLALGTSATEADHHQLPLYNPLVEFSSREELGKMAGYGEDKLSTVIVHGNLLCRRRHHQSCAGDQLEPQPISGASVAVLCGASEGKVRRTSWAKNVTDESGEFLIDLPSQLHSFPNLENICHFQILHLPKESLCHHHSFTRKQYYKRSIKLTSIGDGIRIYTTHRILLITPKSNSHGCTNKIHKMKKRFITL